MSDRFDSMEELLNNAMNESRHNYFAYALGRSRTQDPTQTTVRLALQLIYTQGAKWIELLERFAVNNYELVFEVCRDCPLVFPTLISIAHPVANEPILQEMESKIFEILESNPSDVAWCGFVELVRHRCDEDFKKEKESEQLGLLNRIIAASERNQHFLGAIDLIQDNNSDQYLNSVYSITSFKAFLAIVRLYKSCCMTFRKRMNYLQVLARNDQLIEWIRMKYTRIFDNYQEEISKRETVKSSFKEDFLNCLIELRDFVQIEPIAIKACDRITEILLTWSVVPDQQSETEEQLNWEYGLIYKQYGDDLPSYVAKTTQKLLSSLPGFIRSYLTCLTRQPMQVSQIMMRIAIAHKEINQRKDLISQLLESFFNNLIVSFHPYTQDQATKLQFCRKLRMLFLFAETLKETYFKKMIEEALSMLKNQDYTSICFVEGYNLLNELNGYSKRTQNNHLGRAAILAQEKVPQIIESLLTIIDQTYSHYPLTTPSQKRQGKLNKILTLLEQFLSSNQKIVEKYTPNILKRLCECVVGEATVNWCRGIRTTLVLTLLIRITKMSIMLMSQSYYSNLEESIYKILILLKEHNSREYEQELLQMLIFMINLEQSINPEMCILLLQLNRLVDNSKSLYCILGVVKAICSKKVVASIMYDWPDLCDFFLNLFAKYISQVNINYHDNYPRQWEETLVCFGRFIQVYEQYLDDHLEKRSNILLTLQGMKKDELQLQLFIAMDHHRSVQPFQFFNPEIIPQLTRKNSFKMVYIHLSDKMLRNYQESTMKQLVTMHQIEKEKRIKRCWKEEIHADWPCLETPTQICLQQTLRTLKKSGQIDTMEYNTFMRELDLLY